MRPRHSFAAAVLSTALSLAALPVFAQASVAAPDVLGPDVAGPPVPMLWQVSDDDNSLYLLGAFHMLKADDYPLSGDVEAAFADAERLVFEVSPEQIEDPGNTAKFLQAAGYANGGKLSKVLAPEVHDKLAVMMAKAGMPTASFEGFEPWFVNLSLLMGMAQPMGFSGEQGLDRYLMGRARAAGKPTAGLETIERQLSVLDSSPMDEQVLGLTELVEDPAAAARQLEEMHQVWRQGDVEGLDRIVIGEMKDKTPQTYRTVNIERNQAWLPQLRDMLDGDGGEDAMAVVGAMHLVGEDGLVEALRQAGYRVERICSACKAD